MIYERGHLSQPINPNVSDWVPPPPLWRTLDNPQYAPAAALILLPAVIGIFLAGEWLAAITGARRL